ncbi:unnamed protein product [Pseudo-nitzschia multistriata]|uniref:Uncharacterized protein n=1 Tax=Pseudo-nitzschia multistriata TaxID=183589 RepID=A0A448ZHL7_9STRA|nr:unnamed protein product [Pseudo-nitzschia multistriata]
MVLQIIHFLETLYNTGLSQRRERRQHRPPADNCSVGENLSHIMAYLGLCGLLEIAKRTRGTKAIAGGKDLSVAAEKFWKDMLLVSIWCGDNPKSFRELFRTAITLSPKQRHHGLCSLFYKDNDDDHNDDKLHRRNTKQYDEDDTNITPFGEACWKYGRKETIQLIESTIADSSSRETTTMETECTRRALILAATNENISLDGVYFLLRRDPNLLHGCTIRRRSAKSIPCRLSVIAPTPNFLECEL